MHQNVSFHNPFTPLAPSFCKEETNTRRTNKVTCRFSGEITSRDRPCRPTKPYNIDFAKLAYIKFHPCKRYTQTTNKILAKPTLGICGWRELLKNFQDEWVAEWKAEKQSWKILLRVGRTWIFHSCRWTDGYQGPELWVFMNFCENYKSLKKINLFYPEIWYLILSYCWSEGGPYLWTVFRNML